MNLFSTEYDDNIEYYQKIDVKHLELGKIFLAELHKKTMPEKMMNKRLKTKTSKKLKD